MPCPSVGYPRGPASSYSLIFQVFIGSGINIMLQEFTLDPTYNRFGLLITVPFLVCVSIVSGRPVTSTFLLSFQSVLLLASRRQHLLLAS